MKIVNKFVFKNIIEEEEKVSLKVINRLIEIFKFKFDFKKEVEMVVVEDINKFDKFLFKLRVTFIF